MNQEQADNIVCEECNRAVTCKRGCGSVLQMKAYRDILKNLDKLTHRQLAALNFEIFAEARERTI
jgi:hypothetical protein